MSSHNKGIAVWILGFITFLVCLNAFNGVLLWALHGSDFVFEPYLVSVLTGNLSVTQYLGASLGLAFCFLGGTALIAFRESEHAELSHALTSSLREHKDVLGLGLEDNRRAIQASGSDVLQSLEAQNEALTEWVEALHVDVERLGNRSFKAIKQQSETLHDLQDDLSLTLLTGVNKVHSEVLRALTEQQEIMERVARLRGAIEEARSDLGAVHTRLDALEKVLVLQEPRLRVSSSPEEIRGVGPRTTEELEAIGITTVGEFLVADPEIIENHTRLSREMVERLRDMVQLLMIPDIDEVDVELLERVGVAKKEELAIQDPFALTVRLSDVANGYSAEGKLPRTTPSLEEVMSWVRFAKL